MNSNPLSQYFRQPAIYIRLPSQGKFYPPGSIDMPANGEIPVLPMTTLDEITYRTPDALFNGAAIVSVIESCIPCIKNAWAIPSMDIDTILISIRIATYGQEMDLDTVCPKCENEASYGVDLRHVLDGVKSPDYSLPLKEGDLEIYFKPIDYKVMNDNNLAQFEDQKLLQMLDDGTVPEEQRSKKMGEILKKLTDVTIGALSQSIDTIRTPSAVVDSQDHIREWLSNCDRRLFNKVRDRIVEIKQSGEIKPMEIACTGCGNKFQQAFTMNMTDFFGDAS